MPDDSRSASLLNSVTTRIQRSGHPWRRKRSSTRGSGSRVVRCLDRGHRLCKVLAYRDMLVKHMIPRHVRLGEMALGVASLSNDMTLRGGAAMTLSQAADASADMIFLDAEGPVYSGYWPDLLRARCVRAGRCWWWIACSPMPRRSSRFGISSRTRMASSSRWCR